MPGIKELEQFTTELRKIADEPNITAQWGEKYEELPLPKDTPIPDIDIDNLLDNIQPEIGEAPDDAEIDNMDGTDDFALSETGTDTADFDLPEFSADGSGDDVLPDMGDLPDLSDNMSAADFEMPDFDLPDLTDSVDMDFGDLPEPADTDENAAFGTPEPAREKALNGTDEAQTPASAEKAEPAPSPDDGRADAQYDDMMASASDEPLPDNEVPLFTEPLDEAMSGTASKNSNTGDFNVPNAFDDILSGFDLEDGQGPKTEDTGGGEANAPDALLTGLNDMAEDAQNKPEQEAADFPDFDIDIPDFSPSEPQSTENTAAPEDVLSNTDLPDIETIGDIDEPLTAEPENEAPAENFDFDIPETPDFGNMDEGESSLGENGLDKDKDEPAEKHPDIETMDTAEFPEAVSSGSEPAQTESKDLPDAFADLDGFDMPDSVPDIADLPPEEAVPETNGIENEDTGLDGLEEPTDFDPPPETKGGEADVDGFDEPAGFDLSPETDDAPPAEDPSAGVDLSAPNEGGAGPKEGMTINESDMPALDEHTAFAIDDNVLNTEMGGGMDEFSIPESFTQFSPDKKFKMPDTKKDADSDDSDEKIPLSISEADYDKLINRVSSFPLNVRLEIEDYLVNGDDSELNKMEIVHLIVTDVPLKKIAAKLEGILEKSIPIPRGFDKKSYDEYEQQKKSFKYRFVHKILPVAILTAVIAGLALSLTFLGWQFIYKPAVAEGIYREGFGAIEGGQYAAALKRFDDAGRYTKKRAWYFKFANAFRAKKQFLSAEAVYKRLLFDFRHDKEGGIEYAEMLSKDLRNYEKAEEVLRREVLDYHINDEDALLALGDVFLDWADEQNEKYADAKKIYVSLINTYGEKDAFLSRMMRYFIRTDNLAEVLPLKDHFLDKTLSGDDLVELSGYLLEKRYEPKPSDSDMLRASIEDVRELLEKAIKENTESPEANYNMGRFFIHNRKPEAAKQYLEAAIGLYENSGKMTPRRLVRQLDSMRLYGELLSEEKRYNEAQEVFAKALSKYGDYTAQKLIYPSETVGKLYEDYGDILYFISHNAADDYDYDSALDAYENAVMELNDTPSVQYKMGYIHYKKENYIEAMKAMTLAYADKPNDRNLLYGFGNVLFKRGNYFASQTYFERLMELLEAERLRKGIIFPQTRPDHAAFVEDYMHTSNNLGVVLNRIAVQNGDSKKNGRAIALFGESSRAWDALSRNRETMIRSQPVNLAYANIQNIVKPRSVFEPEIYADIPKTLENEKVLRQLEDK